jgi:hypothetical protein
MGLTLAQSVDGFFEELVVDSLAQEGLKTTPLAESYLVGLLGDFTRTRIPDGPLSVRYLEAQQANDVAESVRGLKEVGDTTLYVTGFFAESIEQGVMPKGFYESLGQSAYSSLASRLQTAGAAEVFGELSQKFQQFVAVLTSVRARVDVANDLTNLCRGWLAKPTADVEKRLLAFGVVLRGEA